MSKEILRPQNKPLAQPEQEPKHLVNVVIAHIKDLRKCVVELQKHGGFDETASEIGVAADELEAALATPSAAQPAPVKPMAHIVSEIDHTGKVWTPAAQRKPLTEEQIDRCIEAADTKWADAFVSVE